MQHPFPSSSSKNATQPREGITSEQAAPSTASRTTEAAQIGTWEWLLATGQVEWSPQADTIFGLAPGTFLGTFEYFLSLVHPSDRAQLQTALQTAIETRQAYHLDHRIITPAGDIRWVSCRGHAVLDTDGRVAGMAGTTEDISRRKGAELALLNLQETLEHRVQERTAGLEQAVQDLRKEIEQRQQTEAALKASEQRYHALYEHNPTMYFTLAPDGTVLSVNRFGAEELGYHVNELVGQSVFAVFQAADHDTVLRQLCVCSQSPGRTFDWEIQKVRKDSQFLWVKERARAITGPDGNQIILIVCEDITEQREAELALRDSEQAIRALQEATSASGLTLDQRIHSVLELGCRRFQLSVGLMTKAAGDQLIITHATDPDRRFAPDLHVPLCKTYCAATLKDTRPVAIEHAGQSCWRTHPGYEMLGMESYLGARLVEDQHVFGTICFLGKSPRSTPFTPAETDFLLLMARWISGELDRRRSEQALRISEERFEIAFRSSPHPVLITELATGRCIEVNDTALRLFGFERHEAVGHTTIAIELWPKPEDRTRFATQLLETGTLREVEFTLQTKDRRLRHCLVSSELIELNGTRCILTVGTDITEKKEAEAALRESEERWQRFVADAPVGLVVVSADKHVLSANKAFCALTGYSEQEVISHTYALYTHPDDLPKNLVLTDEFFAGQRQAYAYEKRYIRKDGEIIWVSVRASQLTVHGHETPLLLAVVEDITDRKQALEERERISQDLHDNLLQSLYAVGMQLEAGKLLAGKAPRKSKQHVTQAIRQLNHLVLEVRQFITDLTRRTAPTLDFTVALNQLVASCSSETRTAPSLDLDPTALTGITPVIGEQLLSIAREALSNSIRHAGATHRTVSLMKTDRSIRLRIADDGKGFDPGRKRRRGHGLANMAARARTIGAQFTLDSVPGRGTSITIDVPTGDPHAC